MCLFLCNISNTINKEEIKNDSSSVAFEFIIPYKGTVNKNVESVEIKNLVEQFFLRLRSLQKIRPYKGRLFPEK